MLLHVGFVSFLVFKASLLVFTIHLNTRKYCTSDDSSVLYLRALCMCFYLYIRSLLKTLNELFVFQLTMNKYALSIIYFKIIRSYMKNINNIY